MDIADRLDKALQYSTADLSILRWMKRDQIKTTLVDGVPHSFHQITSQGAGCRSLVNGSWGFSSTTNVIDAPDIVKTAERLARLSLHGENIEIADAQPVSGRWNPNIEPVTISDTDTLAELIREADQACKSVPHIVSTTVGILIVTDEKVMVTSEGAHIHQTEPRILGTVNVIAKDAGKISKGTETVGGENGLELFEKGYLKDTALTLAQKVSRRLHATLPPSGKTPVVLSGDVVGLLVHEAVGHAAEADIAQCESFLSNKIGEDVASSVISIVDDGTLPGGFGTYGFDDEGVPSEKTFIIINGILKNYLHSRETAYRSNTVSTGNARAWLFSREPNVRMSNTYLIPQDMSFEELLEEVKNGLYLSGDKGGSADRNGQFMFVTSDAQSIRKGELIEEYFVGPTISGNALEAFTKCTGVGDKDTFVLRPALCGKGESAFVGSGGPSMTTQVMVGGFL